MLLEEDFRRACRQYLTSARPIQSVEHLKGREKALRHLVEALNAPGRHAFIYGDRGVGKTSLAHTGAFQTQSSVAPPILVACDNKSSFNSICIAIVRRLLDINPIETKAMKFSGGLGVLGTSASIGYERAASKIDIQINDVNDAIYWFKKSLEQSNAEAIVIIDEFDLFPVPAEHDSFAILIKQLSDQSVPIKLIFCGIAESLDQLFKGHESAHRYIHAERLERLIPGHCIEICDDASKAVQIDVPTHVKYRIAKISDGFPYYVHLICEKMPGFTFEVQHGLMTD
jgi:Cdc6-like AAA superfamily ATPase